ncbi:uncharacterized protein LOC128665146 [Bombina bombina]|uniref:uncharacterized protein LOC128665146 n=1 Tax=Bombina bombina TaxID=8345 RepID=UPI00235A53A1|nr:uncharacterized protein LOC128665146 [Bombina bombina]XP_053575861.1 uncharacterized protein LOC128665146 [Bombina bombina]
MNFNKQLLVVSTIAICVSASHFLTQEWKTWKSKYGKTYVSLDDELFRRKAWEATWDKVQKHNQLADQGLKKYRLAMNHFADMTSEERKRKSCASPVEKSFTAVNAPVHSYSTNSHLRAEVDWRKSSCLSQVKNQGVYCGSCWAFATVGVLESRYCIKKGKLLGMSEQQLIDCDGKSDGCCGGLPVNALEYVSHKGIMRGKNYKYTEKKSACLYNDNQALKLNVTKYYVLPGEKNMAISLSTEGPVTALFAVHEDFMLYSDGIYDGKCAEEVNHAIIIVGYGTEEGEDEAKNEEYWIIRNSWGKEWGEGGYGRVKRNAQQCKIDETAATADITV